MLSRRAATDRNGGPARGGELYKLTITDGWQWKAPLWDLERSVALEQLEQVTGEPDQNAIGNGTLHISEGKGVFPSGKYYWPAGVNSASL